MKKIIAICMAALLLLAALPVSLVLADGEFKIIGTVDKAAACPGDTVTLTVSMEGNPGLVGWSVDVFYDEAALELTTQTAGDAFAGLSFGPLTSPSNALWYDFLNPDVTNNGVLFTLTFVVKEGATGDLAFDLEIADNDPDNISNLAGDALAVNFVDTAIVAGHSYDNACDASCNSCGAVREVAPHPYESAVTKNEDCGNDGVKTYTCPICGDKKTEAIPATGNHTYDTVCDADCNVCGTKREAAAHVYDNACDADCNVCGATRTPAAHVYDDACDVDCNECGATRTAPHSYTYACDATCALCGELTNPEAAHDILHMDAVEPGCHYDGNVEYWTCAYCGSAWLDAEMTQVSNQLSVILPALKDVDVIHVEAVEATEEKEGNIEYWYCEKCEQFWQDEALTQLTNSKNVITPKKEAPTTTTTKGEETTTTKPADENGANKTEPMGENVVVILVAGMIALIAAAAVVLFSKKKA